MSTTNPQRAASSYFGSLVIFAAFIGMVFGPASVLVYSFGVFVGPIEQTFGWTRGQISIAATIIVFVSVITQPIQGILVDRYGVRRVALISVPIFCASIAGLYFIPANIAVFYGAWVAVTLCGMALWNGSYNKVMAAWYDRKLGMAVGVIGAGQGVGAALVPLFCQTLVTHVGWRGAYVGLALITLVMTFTFNYLFLYNEPADKGLLPDGDGVASRAERILPEGLTFKEALKERPFWIMAVCFFLLGTMTTTIVAHLIPMLVDRGIPPQTAVLSMSAFGIAVILGRICAGLSLDYFYAPWVLIGFMTGTDHRSRYVRPGQRGIDGLRLGHADRARRWRRNRCAWLSHSTLLWAPGLRQALRQPACGIPARRRHWRSDTGHDPDLAGRLHQRDLGHGGDDNPLHDRHLPNWTLPIPGAAPRRTARSGQSVSDE